MTAAGRGREERGSSAPALLSSALPQALRSPTAKAPFLSCPRTPGWALDPSWSPDSLP